MTAADGVSRTTYMPKSIERENQGMIAWNEWLEGGRGCSRALPVGPGATIYARTYSQPQCDPWKACSFILATFSPLFYYAPLPAAAYLTKTSPRVSFFFPRATLARVSRVVPKDDISAKLIYVHDEELIRLCIIALTLTFKKPSNLCQGLFRYW